MQKRKIAIIGTAGLPASYGGFETLAEHLVEELSNRYRFSIYCSAKKTAKDRRTKLYKRARLYYLPLDANGIQSILYDIISIFHALWYADILMILGVSGTCVLPFVRLFTSKKIITSIDGIEWKRAKWGKVARLYLWAAEWLAAKFSHAIISDNESIQDYTAVRYGSLSTIIEYGADHTIKVKPEDQDKEKYPFLKMPYAFKVCRIEPENNVDMVLHSFAQLPQHKFIMVGNWSNSEYGINLRKQYTAYSNLVLLDPIYDQRELDVLHSNCLLYIHGHSAGGTNPSLVEAMCLGLPVVAYGVSYNKVTTEGKALYFLSGQDLVNHITKTSFADLKKLAAQMKEIADRRYTWKIIAEKYACLADAVATNNKRTYLQPRISLQLQTSSLLQYELGHLQANTFFYENR